MKPSRKAGLCGTCRQGLKITLGSFSHGSVLTTHRSSNSKSRVEVASGPTQDSTPMRPFRTGLVCPPSGIRLADGRMAYVPLQMAGIRIEPAMSEPIPRTEPRMAIKAPSPPDEPPAVRLDRWGLRVRPKTWLWESAACRRMRYF